MPRIRLLSDNSLASSSEASSVDAQGNLIFDIGFGDTVQLYLDATGYAGTATVSASTWTSPDTVTLSAPSLVSPVATVLAAIPPAGTGDWRRGFRVFNEMTLSNGRVRNTMVWLRGAGGSVT
jgi:hypothetical protein